MTPKESFEWLDEALKTDRKRTAGLDVTFGFVLEGDNGGDWWIETGAGRGTVHEGRNEGADVTCFMTDEIFVKLATGELEGQEAFINGLVRVEGEEPLAMFLAQIFGV